MEANDKHILYRMYLTAFVVLVLAIAIAVKLANIQIVEGDHYRKLALERTVKNFVIPANKGNIYSADGSLLATSIPNYKIRFDALAPTKDDFNENLQPLCDSLSTMLGKPSQFYKSELLKARSSKNRYYLIARSLSYTEYIRIKSFPLFNKGPYKGGIITEQRTIREHPIGLIAERTIGYERITPNGNPDGKGIEWAFKDYLNGNDGKRLMQKMSKGQWKPIRDENEIEPQDGYDVISTIDVYMQDIAHHALLKQLQYYEADHGCVVVMETKTGHVKAISNLGRDKNGNYSETINYAIQESHEPGSTFKILDLLALFEDKKADTNTVYDSNGGEITYYNRRVRDSKKGGYGKITLARGFELSSNTVLVQAVYENYKTNPQKFVDHIKRMKLHEPLGLQLKGEGKPIIPQPGEKNWYGTTLPWMAYGYNVSMTPLQTLTLYNAVANDGEMVKPLFVKEVKEWNKTIKTFEKEVIVSQIASKETIDKVKVVLENVVKRGTGSKLYSKDFSMAGKTGTAQINYATKANLYYASSFVGYFPADQPKYSCIVVIHKPSITKGYYGADVSGPVFKRIAQKVFTDVPSTNEVRESDKSNEIQDANFEKYYTLINKDSKTIPNVVGMAGMDAVALFENLKMKVKIIGQGKVKKQSIHPGEPLQQNKTIILELS
ncbi:penicillin-binding protein [Flavobacterium orientale]|uniref:Penicillin-binding protein n=1 Tax=Flavobacterium orientale TaxID=1756020 RepID=A0A917D9H8_9FLAO|nr:penicillin-binding protein [Flavobacterium orientale]GGD13681.1 penicillin-binding protein [Flavobacterium orientale]